MGLLLTGILVLGSSYTGAPILQYWPQITTNACLNIILFYILFCFNFFVSERKWIVAKKYLFGLTGTAIITIIFTRISIILRALIFDSEPSTNVQNINIIKEALTSISVILVCFLLYTVSCRIRSLIEIERLNLKHLNTKYNALESKLDPHFLFNSLNILNGIIAENKNGQLYVEQLANIYRYILGNKKIIELKEELEFTKSYVYLMQIRYNQNIKVEWNIDKELLDYITFPISIQLLVENAIKHNTVSDKYPITIRIYTTENQTIKVENNINPLQQPVASTGIGLENLRERYMLLTSESIQINQSENLFIVELPLLNKDDIETNIKKLAL